MKPQHLLILLAAFAATGIGSEFKRRSPADGDAPPPEAKPFAAFAKDGLQLEWDEKFLYVGGNGLPAHPMMKGITAWQQQVPIPHDFTGERAFQIPRNPTPGEASELTYLGPIAIAANGIPIFHPLTQSGKDAFLGGELDEWGGHCGRADDYHYHLAPAHLEEEVGKGNPVAYGLDGFPIHVADPDKDKPLDECHGYTDDTGKYRYVSSPEFPYMMAKFRGAVDLDARPDTRGVRPHLTPLRGATITGFEGSLAEGYHLTYELGGQDGHVRYQVDGDTVTFQFTDADGSSRQETHTRKERGGGGTKFTPEGKTGRPGKGKAGRPGGKGKAGRPDQPPRPGEKKNFPNPTSEIRNEGRSPWILAHAAELDADGDSTFTREELAAELDRVFATGAKGERTRSALSGFLKDHHNELDRDGDGSVSKEEATSQFNRMFDKADTDGDGRITKEQYAGATPKNDPRPPKR